MDPQAKGKDGRMGDEKKEKKERGTGTSKKPWKERTAEYLAVLFFMISTFGALLGWALAIALLLASKTTAALVALYLAWMFLGPGQPIRNKRWSTPLRNASLWKHFAAYFPMKLVKTAELDPKKTYVFAYHPHGVICLGGWGNFMTNATGFDDLFYGIQLHALTLKMNLNTPFLRTYLHWHGASDVSKQTCRKILERGPGSAIFLAVGGALESLHAYPGEYDIVLKHRKGFVRVALQTGSSLVPVLSFGEPDTFLTRTPRPGTPGRQRLYNFYRRFGIVFPEVTGDFWHLFGFMPQRTPIVSVVGSPLEVPRTDGTKGDPDFEAVVDHYHALYVERLRDLWDQHKNTLALHRIGTMKVVE